MPQFWLGIDGGGSNIRVALAKAGDGAIVGQATASQPGNWRQVGWPQVALHLATTLQSALQQCGGQTTEIIAVAAGLAGVRTAAEQTDGRRHLAALWPHLADSAVLIDSDLRVAHHGALDGAPGVLLVAGTGSAAYARNARGQLQMVGGWGPLLGDEGSGYALGMEALRTCVRVADGRVRGTRLAEAVRQTLGITEPRQLLDHLATTLDRPAIAALAPVVLRLADEGDRVATALVQATAGEGLELAVAAARALWKTGTVRACVVGGLSQHPVYQRALAQQALLHDRLDWQAPAREAVLGAVSLAACLAGS